MHLCRQCVGIGWKVRNYWSEGTALYSPLHESYYLSCCPPQEVVPADYFHQS